MDDSSKYNINPAGWEFEFQQRDVHPAIMTDLWLRATRDQLAVQFRLPVKNPDYLFTSTYKGYILSANKKDILHQLKDKIKDHGYLDYILRRTMEIVEEFDVLMEESAAKISKEISRQELAEMWMKIEEKYLQTVPWYWIPWYLTEENLISDRVKIGLEKYREEVEKMVDFNTALGILIFPRKEALFQREQKDFCDLVRTAGIDPAFKTRSDFQRRADEYLGRYAWMKTYFLLPIEPLSMEELLNRIEGAATSDLLKEHDFQEKKKLEYLHVSEKLMAIFGDDKELLDAIKDAQELAWVLTASVEQGVHAASKSLPFNKVLARNLAVPYKDWIHLKSNEIMDSLRGGMKISEDTIRERIAGTAALMQSGMIHWMWGEEAKSFTEYVESGAGRLAADLKEFKGQPAFRGKVIGKVRIALTPKDSNDLINGEILVTSMTSPDYVPAMRRAGAIVTNEGGLLSHAAIMSREFGKPCVVGTKIATNILKNGDTIEVDADKGIIRLIK